MPYFIVLLQRPTAAYPACKLDCARSTSPYPTWCCLSTSDYKAVGVTRPFTIIRSISTSWKADGLSKHAKKAKRENDDACGGDAWDACMGYDAWGEEAWGDEAWGSNDWWGEDEDDWGDAGSEWTRVWEQDESGNVVKEGTLKRRREAQEAKMMKDEKKPGRKSAATPPKKGLISEPKPKAKGKAKSAPKASPKNPKDKARSKTSKKAEEEVSKEKGKKVDEVLGWVDFTDVDVDPTTYKDTLLPHIPDCPDSIRLNKYWNRSSCGVTLKYVEDEQKKQKDVAYYAFEKSNVGMAVALACALFTVPWLRQPTEIRSVLPIPERFKHKPEFKTPN